MKKIVIHNSSTTQKGFDNSFNSDLTNCFIVKIMTYLVKFPALIIVIEFIYNLINI